MTMAMATAFASRQRSKRRVGASSFSSSATSLTTATCLLLAIAFSLSLIGLTFQFIAIHRFRNDDITSDGPFSAMMKMSMMNEDKSKRGAKKPVVAYAVTITGCGGDKRYSSEDAASLITQGAAVLKHSIHLAHTTNDSSKYDYQMYAIIHPNARSCAVVPMEKLGYTVLIRNTPIDKLDISTKFLREHIDGASCCGAKEFLKLYAYTLSAPLAVILDLDSLVLKNMDVFFDAMLYAGDQKKEFVDRLPIHIHDPIINQSGDSIREHAALYNKTIDAFYTKDYNMVNFGQEKYAGMQGGFLILRPDENVFSEYVDLILQGNYIEGMGWGGKYGYFYGGAQVQGLSSYYFGEIHPEKGVELNRCRINQMADNPIFGPKDKLGAGKCRDGRKKCEDCRETKLSDIWSAHFTVCGKPWRCSVYVGSNISIDLESESLCPKLHREWFRIRRSYEESRGLDEIEFKQLPKLEGSYMPQIFYGYCTKAGDRGYLPLKI